MVVIPEQMSVKETAEALCVSVKTVHKMIREGALHGHRLTPKITVVEASSVKALLDRTLIR